MGKAFGIYINFSGFIHTPFHFISIVSLMFPFHPTNGGNVCPRTPYCCATAERRRKTCSKGRACLLVHLLASSNFRLSLTIIATYKRTLLAWSLSARSKKKIVWEVHFINSARSLETKWHKVVFLLGPRVDFCIKEMNMNVYNEGRAVLKRKTIVREDLLFQKYFVFFLMFSCEKLKIIMINSRTNVLF